MIAKILRHAASGIVAALICATSAQAQTQPPSRTDIAGQETSVEDIVVEGRPLREATADYVGRISAPARGSGAAVWHQPLCIGVGNLQPAAAQAIIDGISDVAASLDVRLDDPGCAPRVFIVFASDPDAAARDVVSSRRRELRLGVSGADRGTRAFEAFQTTNAPVRWWQVSVPVNEGSGQLSGRIPGTAPFEGPQSTSRPSDFGPSAFTTTSSRLRSPNRDDLAQIIIIVAIDAAASVDPRQLIDYLAMISLAQIDPEADPGGYDSILSLFRAGGGPPGLTDWDRAFLGGLYGAEQMQRNANFRLGSVADAMAQAVRTQQAATGD